MQRLIFILLLLLYLGCREHEKICAPNHIRKFFTIEGISCGSCEEIIQKMLEDLKVSYVKLHLDKDANNLELCFDEKVGFEDIKNALHIYEVFDNK